MRRKEHQFLVIIKFSYSETNSFDHISLKKQPTNKLQKKLKQVFQRFCYPAILKSKFLVQTVLTCLEEFLALTRVENLVKLSF